MITPQDRGEEVEGGPAFGPSRIESCAGCLEMAYQRAHDPKEFGIPALAFMFTALSGLRDMATEDPEGMFAVLRGVEPKVLRWTFAQLARELGHAGGWEVPPEDGLS